MSELASPLAPKESKKKIVIGCNDGPQTALV
jgi:hypothetical protein